MDAVSVEQAGKVMPGLGDRVTHLESGRSEQGYQVGHRPVSGVHTVS
jgi:hypothetical protein